MATVDRVLPWRRHAPHPGRRDRAAGRRLPASAIPRRRSARSSGPTRWRPRPTSTSTASRGEKYINHPLSVAKIVADIGLDDTTVAAALLHDAVEDTGVTTAEIEERFGTEIAAIVDGVTKLERIRFDSREEQQAATMRKMLVAMAKDLRVLIIKLADRLHNMRTIAAMSPEQAGAHRPGDARHLRAAGPPPRHAGDQAAARGPVLRRPAPQALRRDRQPGRAAHARARPLPRRGRGRGPGPAGRAQDRRRGHRPGQAPLEHLREDGAEGARSSTTSSTWWASGSSSTR